MNIEYKALRIKTIEGEKEVEIQVKGNNSYGSDKITIPYCQVGLVVDLLKQALVEVEGDTAKTAPALIPHAEAK